MPGEEFELVAGVRPYPSQWERHIVLGDGWRIFVRPVRPNDAHLGHCSLLAGRSFSPLGLWGILVLDLGNGISGFAKSDQHSLGEMNTFFVTFRHWVPRRAVPRTGMIDESGFDGACHDDKGVF
jgi:hypothetical protein